MGLALPHLILTMALLQRDADTVAGSPAPDAQTPLWNQPRFHGFALLTLSGVSWVSWKGLMLSPREFQLFRVTPLGYLARLERTQSPIQCAPAPCCQEGPFAPSMTRASARPGPTRSRPWDGTKQPSDQLAW